MEDQETLGARLARANWKLVGDRKRERQRAKRLENAIRRHATEECGCATERICLMNLYRLIPIEERR